jgi:dTDP-4-amino-4,6-dideoxygalactose transaminase
VVFIHYFGWPDSELEQAINLARQYDAVILEDEAHALYSDYVTGMCGRLGDAAIVSLHKMLPFGHGGWLILNRSLAPVVLARIRQLPVAAQTGRKPFDYDFISIAERRRHHAQILLEALVPLRGRVDPLYSGLTVGVIPQTLPVLIYGRSRDELYFQMNEAGFGVVSLYHTLIDEIRLDEYPDSHWLAQHVMNLPVHQDVLPDNLVAMVNYMSQLVR